jgi:phosphoglycerol geranylgeranyltransferase
MRDLLQEIIGDSIKGRKKLALLLDPDEYNKSHLDNLFSNDFNHIDYFFVGGSLIKEAEQENLIQHLRTISSKPIILFPGSSGHISSNADAILFLSLLSGRNPEYLIGQQVISAPLVKRSKLEVLSTAYLLVDGGRSTTVQYMSNTFPLPNDKPDIAACTALAGKYMGFSLIYLDAGSGAQKPISASMISAVKKETGLPLIVGGGIKSYEQMEEAYDAGADVVVIGNAIQNQEVKLNELQVSSIK